MASFEFLTDDWKKIPQTIKVVFGLGVFLILLPWAVDYWGIYGSYTLFGWDFRGTAFELGVCIILLAFIPLLKAQFVYWKRAYNYRKKYPLTELDKKFVLVWFNGKLYLFDKLEKKYYHIYPWETAQDLFFVGTGLQVFYDFEEAIIKSPNSGFYMFAEYSSGGVINTRG